MADRRTLPTQGSSFNGNPAYSTSDAITPTNERRISASSGVNLDEILDGKAKNELLLRAITKGQTARILHLLASGADIDYQDQQGQGVLHYAIASGHDHVFDVLVHRGADVDLISPLQGTPICAAAQLQRWSIVEKLFELKVDVNSASTHRGTALHWACRWGETKIVALLLNHGATQGIIMDLLLVKTSKLQEEHAHTQIWDPERTPTVQDVPVFNVRTALLLAAQFGHHDCVQALLASSNQRSMALSKQEEGQWALRYAISHGATHTVRLILEFGINPDSGDNPEGNCALLVAFEHRSWASFKELRKHNARTNIIDRDGHSMLRSFLAIESDDFKQFFVARWQSLTLTEYLEPHIANSEGDQILQMLLEVRTDFASALHRQDIDTAELHFVYRAARAARAEDNTVFRTMQTLGGNVNVMDHLGNTALSLATSVGDLTAMERLCLASKRTHLSFDFSNCTSLMVAVERLHVEAVEHLLSWGAKPNVTCSKRWTPLHFAAKHGHVEIIELLVKAGAELNTKDTGDHTPVEIALQSKQVTAMDALIRLGANPVDAMLLI
ncbi:Transient receptor putative cation channel subfamily A member 1 [Oleoguttula sp. CCFEE 5521]